MGPWRYVYQICAPSSSPHKGAKNDIDIYESNMLFAIPHTEALSEVDVLVDLRKPIVTKRVRRRDGLRYAGDDWAPRYIVEPQPLRETTHGAIVNLDDFKLKLIDLGSGK